MSTRSISALVVPGYLALAGCSSGITQADQICTSSRISVAAFVDCLRSNYGTLSNGSSGQSDLGALYLAAAEYKATEVAGGGETDAMAMLELANFRTRVFAPMEQQRRDQEFQNVMKAIQGAGNSGSPSGRSASGQSQSRH